MNRKNILIKPFILLIVAYLCASCINLTPKTKVKIAKVKNIKLNNSHYVVYKTCPKKVSDKLLFSEARKTLIAINNLKIKDSFYKKLKDTKALYLFASGNVDNTPILIAESVFILKNCYLNPVVWQKTKLTNFNKINSELNDIIKEILKQKR